MTTQWLFAPIGANLSKLGYPSSKTKYNIISDSEKYCEGKMNKRKHNASEKDPEFE